MVESNINIPFEQIINEGVELSKRLFQFSLDLSRKIPKHSSIDEKEDNRRAVLKGFLISAAQLSGQIIEAVVRRHLSLAIIGSRTLLEFSIDANYIFDNPNHKNDLTWVDTLCKDLFDRTNSFVMPKSKLGTTSFRERANEINRLDLYEKNYASLCDYSHLMLRHPFLNSPQTLEKLSIGTISQSLCNLVGVIDSVVVFQNFKWDENLLKEVLAFRDRYE